MRKRHGYVFNLVTAGFTGTIHSFLQRFVLEKSGLGSFYKSLRRRNPSSGSTDDSRKEHFSTLPCNTLEMLHRHYEEDFLMFGYDAAPFFDMCLKRRKYGQIQA